MKTRLVVLVAIGVLTTLASFGTLLASHGNARAYDACQCTGYASSMRPDLPQNLGDAKDWARNAAAQGFVVDSTPEVGAIAVFPPGIQGAFAAGHVAVVDAVYSAMSFHVSERNFGGYCRFNTRTANTSGGVQFIHRSATARTGPPSDLSARGLSGTEIEFSWRDNSDNESGFGVWRWSGSSWTNIANVGQNVTQFVDRSLQPNTTYYYIVCNYQCAANYTQATTQGGGGGGGVPRFCEDPAQSGYGRCLNLGPGRYDMTEYDMNDKITTIIISAGTRYRVKFYEHVNTQTNECYGAGWQMTSGGGYWAVDLYNAPFYFDDRISCIIVEAL